MNNKMLLAYQDSGLIDLSQNGGVDDSVVEQYRQLGLRADFFDRNLFDIGSVFVSDGEIKRRPQLLAQLDKQIIRADGQDYARLRGVPAGAYVSISDGLVVKNQISDGSVFFITSRTVGRLVITIDAAPHLLQTLVLEAVCK